MLLFKLKPASNNRGRLFCCLFLGHVGRIEQGLSEVRTIEGAFELFFKMEITRTPWDTISPKRGNWFSDYCGDVVAACCCGLMSGDFSPTPGINFNWNEVRFEKIFFEKKFTIRH